MRDFCRVGTFVRGIGTVVPLGVYVRVFAILGFPLPRILLSRIFVFFVAPGLAASAMHCGRMRRSFIRFGFFIRSPLRLIVPPPAAQSRPRVQCESSAVAIRSTLHQHNHSTDTRSIDGLLLRAQQKESQGTLLHSKD